MDYDFRNRTGPPFEAQVPMYRQQPASSSSSAPFSHPMYGPSLHPRIVQRSHTVLPHAPRASSFHQTSSPSSSSGLGIRVALKPEYRITPQHQLLPQVEDIPSRSNIQFDFDFERKILAEAEKETMYWSRLGLDNLTSKPTESSSSQVVNSDPVLSKYVVSGLSKEAVSVAVANYGDNPTKVREFINGYNLLQEMGFSPNNVAEVLLMYDNDTDQALTHFLNSSFMTMI